LSTFYISRDVGNICRSPIAEAVFAKLIKDAGKDDDWIVDSAAIGSWHVGKSPDRRALSVLKKHNVPTNHKARQVCVNQNVIYE
jgi:low molecular weight phosphotyrosine protein phosphatase